MLLKNKLVFITGASSGIGKSCAIEFAKLGANLIIAARRIERLESFAKELETEYHIKALPVQLDVGDKASVASAITNLAQQWADIDILVNNAGLALASDLFQDGKTDNWDRMIDVNIKGVLYVTHAILPQMIRRNAGHIVNIGSSAGHDYYLTGNVYSATKHAVRALSRSLRIDLLGKNIKVSEIDPGQIGGTEFSLARWNDQEKTKKFYSQFTPLLPDDIADAVIYCVTRKPHVNISEILVYSIDQASANHTHKKL